jgi:CheY-like chemotaxis protein
MAGGIAHDFNNILMVVIGHIEMAMDDDALSAETRNHLEESMSASQRAAKLVNQMLAYSGKGHFVVTPLDLNQAVEEAVEFVRSAVPPEVTLETRLSPDGPVIDADTAQLNQILSNLVVNAWESLQGRTDGRVVVATGIETSDAQRLEATAPEAWLGYDGPLEGICCGYLEVSDNGCGMDAETRKRMFEPFFTTKFQGRGLGLAAVIGIVRGHKGFVHVDSTPGEGTAVRVLFPLRESAPKPAAPKATADMEGAPRGSGRVLVVDDEEAIRDLMGSMLEKAGYAVILAANGLEALSRYHRHAGDIALILMDLSMPLMGGVEAFMELRRTGCDVPVILCSGYSESQIRQEYAGKGFAGFIEKPCPKRMLLDLVGEAMGTIGRA